MLCFTHFTCFSSPLVWPWFIYASHNTRTGRLWWRSFRVGWGSETQNIPLIFLDTSLFMILAHANLTVYLLNAHVRKAACFSSVYSSQGRPDKHDNRPKSRLYSLTSGQLFITAIHVGVFVANVSVCVMCRDFNLGWSRSSPAAGHSPSSAKLITLRFPLCQTSF